MKKKVYSKHESYKVSLNGNYQTAKYIVRQRIFQGMRDVMAIRPQNSTTGNKMDLVKDFDYTFSKSLFTENLLNGKKIVYFFDEYNKPDLFLLLLFLLD